MTGRPRLVLLALVMVVAAAGCSAEDEPAASAPSSTPLPTLASGDTQTPAGWSRYSRHGVSFAHPADWTVTERMEADGPVVVVEGPSGEGELPQQVVLAVQPEFTGDLEGLVTAFEAVRELPGQEVVRDEDVALAGARDARLTERTFDAPAAADTSVPARVRELRLVTEQSAAVSFLVRSAQSDFEGALPEVFESFQLD